MPKVKISEYSATANSNTDVASINIDEGCAPSGINNAIRAVMGHLKDFQQGTNGDPFNGPVNGTLGATTAATANVTTLTTSSTVTHNGGTANGVAYLNGSKVLTTGSALVFDGSNLGVGVTPSAWSSSFKVLQLANGTSLSNNGQTSYYQLGANNYYDGSNYKYIASNFAGFHRFSNAGAYEWHNAPSGTAGNAITFTQAMTLDASGNLGIGTTSPSALRLTLEANGNQLRLRNTTTRYRSDLSVNATGTAEWNCFDDSGGVYMPMNLAGSVITFGTGSGSSPERARIDSSGNLLVGTTINAASAKIFSAGPILTDWSGIIALRYNSAGSINSYYKGMTGTAISNGAARGLHIFNYDGDSNPGIQFYPNSYAGQTASPSITIDPQGNLLVGTTSNGSSARCVIYGGTFQMDVYNASGQRQFLVGSGSINGTANGADAIIYLNKSSGTSRSINAAGTINASGADYAEYMTKSGDFTVAKGDVVGINANGRLTNVFADAISFIVKSTDPSYVGGDTWFVEKPKDENHDDLTSGPEYDAWVVAQEAARQTVDRVAFAGQVPVNVVGATAGQYIIPVNDNGAIKGEAVSNPTFEQYQTAVGKVISIESDGRAKIIVKVA